MKRAIRYRRRGFLLLEMILAMAVFALTVTGFVVALQRMSQTASAAHTELQVTRVLESAMNEIIGAPVLEPGEKRFEPDDSGIEVLRLIERIEDLQNRDGAALDEIYRIRLSARWYQDGEWRDRTIETWRNSRMYQSP